MKVYPTIMESPLTKECIIVALESESSEPSRLTCIGKAGVSKVKDNSIIVSVQRSLLQALHSQAHVK